MADRIDDPMLFSWPELVESDDVQLMNKFAQGKGVDRIGLARSSHNRSLGTGRGPILPRLRCRIGTAGVAIGPADCQKARRNAGTPARIARAGGGNTPVRPYQRKEGSPWSSVGLVPQNSLHRPGGGETARDRNTGPKVRPGAGAREAT